MPGVAEDLGGGVGEVELVLDVIAVGLDSVGADAKFFGDFPGTQGDL